MSLLFRFPCDICVSVLSQWCEVKDLVGLDSACCYQNERHNLLEIFRLQGFCLPSTVQLPTLSFLATKAISFKTLYCVDKEFVDKVHNTELLEKLINFSKVSEIIIECNSLNLTFVEFCYKLINKCESLIHLNVNIFGGLRREHFSFLTLNPNILNHLIELYSYGPDFTSQVYQYLARHCHSLTSIEVTSIYAVVLESDIIGLLKSNKNLSKICFDLTDSDSQLGPLTFQYIINHCPLIKELELASDPLDVSLTMAIDLLSMCVHCGTWTIENQDSYISYSSINADHSHVGMRNIEVCGVEWLKFLSLVKGCVEIGFRDMATLDGNTLQHLTAVHSFSLSKLSFYQCPLLTTEDIMKLLEYCLKLTSITIEVCPLIDRSAIQKQTKVDIYN